MKVMFPVGRRWTDASAWLAQRLERDHGVQAYAFTHYQRWANEAVRQGFAPERVFYVNQGAQQAMASQALDRAALERFEKEYGEPTLWPFIIADRHIGGLTHEEVLKLLVVEFTRIERFLDETRPDTVIIDAVDRMGLLFLYKAALARGIQVLIPTVGRVSGRYAILDNPYDWHGDVNTWYERYRGGGLPDEERGRAEDFVADFVKHRRVPAAASYTFESPTLSSYVDKGLEYVRQYQRFGGREEYSSTPPLAHVGRSLQRIAGWRAHQRDPRFERSRPGEQFVFFPLQVHPEASIMVQAPRALDQAAVVEQVATSIPVGHKLYVKEHFAAVGSRNPGFYRRLRRLPNVRLISAFERSHDLIEAADLIVTITSTVGWEALIYGKPVITFGQAFYNVSQQVRNVSDMQALAPAVVDAVAGAWPDRDDTLALVAAVLRGTHEGELDPGAAAFLDPANLEGFLNVLQPKLGLPAGS